MKKIIFILTIMLCSIAGKAQIATQNSNALDNIYVGVTGGVSTPLDFNSVFPLNPNAGIVVGKNLTPYFGFNVEGIAILNDNHFSDIKTSVKATNVGVNGIVNLSNVFFGYKGTPRVFEVSTSTGLGWLHTWNTGVNNLTAKTGLNFVFNIGKKKAHSIMITPAVYWNLNKFGDIKFNKAGSQIALNLTYIYHFKTSNGTHSFKTYDIGAMISEIDRLNGALSECESREPVEKIVVKEVPVPTTAAVATASEDKIVEYIVMFAKNSYELTSDAKNVLDNVSSSKSVSIVGLASPEGTEEYNLEISQKRADAVADYLKNRGLTVSSAVGKGVLYGKSTNRIVIITEE